MSEIIERVHPGRIIRKSIEALNMSSKEFSYRTGISERTLSDLINEKGTVTFDVAEKLSEFFGNDIRVWANLQTQYTYYLSQLNYQNEINEDFKCIKSNIPYLKNILYIEDSDDKETIVKKVRSTIKVNKLVLLKEAHSFASLKEQHTLSKTHNFEQNLWISLSLTLARKNEVASFNKQKLKDSIDEIRLMTTQNPSIFYPRLQKLLSECGVSLVLMPYLAKSNLYGATKWLNSENVMLALSNRRNRADSFWFAFFHELAHVMFEHKRYMLISSSELEDKDADDFAKNILIPEEKWINFVAKNNFSEQSIVRFAKDINILPLIVLGRLENEKLIPYGILDKNLSVNYQIQF